MEAKAPIFEESALSGTEKYPDVIQRMLDTQRSVLEARDKEIDAKIARVTYLGYFVITLFTLGLAVAFLSIHIHTAAQKDRMDIMQRLTVIETERRIERERGAD